MRGALPEQWLTVHRRKLHNLRNVPVRVPLQRLVAVTGVSGSGKSTLARDVLMANLLDAVGRSRAVVTGDRRARKAAQDEPAANRRSSVLARSAPRAQLNVTHAWQGCDAVTGWESIDRVLEVDQTPIGKTPRSCPATYIGVLGCDPQAVRRDAGSQGARLRGLALLASTPAAPTAAARRAKARACARSR
jgi:excinuclease ABC subunit A